MKCNDALLVPSFVRDSECGTQAIVFVDCTAKESLAHALDRRKTCANRRKYDIILLSLID